MQRARILTAQDRGAFDSWFALAINDLGVWPFLNFSSTVELPPPENSDWARIYVLSAGGRALMRLNFGREDMSVSVSVWALSGPRKRLEAGAVLAELPALARRYGARFINAACHASNHDSAAMLTKRLGKPWGRAPENAWNGALGLYEDSLHFRSPVRR